MAAQVLGGVDGRELLVLIDRYADLVAAKEVSAASTRTRISGIVFQLCDDAADYRLVSGEVAGKLLGDGWDDDAAEVAIVIGWAAHMAAVHPDCPGRFCDAANGGPGPGPERCDAPGVTL